MCRISIVSVCSVFFLLFALDSLKSLHKTHVQFSFCFMMDCGLLTVVKSSLIISILRIRIAVSYWHNNLSLRLLVSLYLIFG